MDWLLAITFLTRKIFELGNSLNRYESKDYNRERQREREIYEFTRTKEEIICTRSCPYA